MTKHCFLILAIVLALIASGCRRSENETPRLAPLQTTKDTTLQIDQPKEILRAKSAAKERKKSSRILDVKIQTPLVTIDTPSLVMQTKIDSTAHDDSPHIDTIHIRQLLFGQALSSSPLILHKRYVPPDSQKWEDIVGFQPERQETPTWIKVLGILRTVATLAVIGYLIFFD